MMYLLVCLHGLDAGHGSRQQHSSTAQQQHSRAAQQHSSSSTTAQQQHSNTAEHHITGVAVQQYVNFRILNSPPPLYLLFSCIKGGGRPGGPGTNLENGTNLKSNVNQLKVKADITFSYEHILKHLMHKYCTYCTEMQRCADAHTHSSKYVNKERQNCYLLCYYA
jgi:hypothetical protein